MCLALSAALGLPAAASGSTTEPTTPAPTATSDPFAYPSPETDAPPVEDFQPPLSPRSIESQVAEAERLRAEILESNQEIAAALKRLEKLADEANEALEAYGKAQEVAQEARAVADENRRLSESVERRLAQGREEMRLLAFDVYTHGGSYAESLAFFESLVTAHEGSVNPIADFAYVTDERLRIVERIRVLEEQQQEVTDRAEAAERRAVSTATKAKAAKKEAKAAVTRQDEGLEQLREDYRDQLQEAGPVVGFLFGLVDPEAKRAADALREALTEAGLSLEDLDLEPCTKETGTYPNGQVPPSALCPVTGSPDEFLRPRAAASFNAMSKAYARETGHLLCIIDGYRSYPEQVIVKADRGRFAATPGTSEHGRGHAVDLCGGVQSFGHPAHLWMQRNAPLFGWYHPSWAAAGGTLPEPWHWEYAG